MHTGAGWIWMDKEIHILALYYIHFSSTPRCISICPPCTSRDIHTLYSTADSRSPPQNSQELYFLGHPPRESTGGIILPKTPCSKHWGSKHWGGPHIGQLSRSCLCVPVHCNLCLLQQGLVESRSLYSNSLNSTSLVFLDMGTFSLSTV